MPEEVLVGWRTSSPQARLAFLPPEPVSEADAAAAAPMFPGIPGETLARRLIQVRSPFDLRIRLVRHAGGARFQRVPEPGGLSEAGFAGLVTPIVPSAQRRRELPAVQVSLNLILVTEEACALHLMPPWGAPSFRDWPGTLVCGRFPLRSWPRALNAILEWQEPERDWVLRRGEPVAWFFLHFDDPDKVPKLVEASLTPALKRHLAQVDNVGNLGRNVGPMFAQAEERRPARLLTPVAPWTRRFGDGC